MTGGGGFIGSALSCALIGAGYEVRILDNLITGSEERVPADAELVKSDLRDLDGVRRACRGVDVVFHQAAIRSVPRSIEDPALAESCNSLGTLHVLVGSEEAGVERIVYASSSSAYGGAREGVSREDMASNPLSPYAVSKLSGENYCRVWSITKGLSTVSLRYFNVFGPGQQPDSKYSAVFPAFISALAQRRAPEVHWDGGQSRDFTYIDDVVRANMLAATADARADGAVINIAGGHPRSINDTLAEISKTMGVWIDPVRLPKRSGDVRSSHADISRAAELIGWTPRARFEDAVRHTVEWLTRIYTVPAAAAMARA